MNPERTSQVFIHPLIWGPTALGLIIAVSIPDDVFMQSSFAHSFYEYARRLMPMIERHAQYSAFPDVTRLYLAIAWPLAALQVVTICIRYVRFCENQVIARFTSNVARLKITNSLGLPLKTWAPFALVALQVGGIWGWFFLGKDPSFCEGCANANRFGMALIHNALAPWAIGLLFAVSLTWVRNIRTIYFPDSI